MRVANRHSPLALLCVSALLGDFCVVRPLAQAVGTTQFDGSTPQLQSSASSTQADISDGSYVDALGFCQDDKQESSAIIMLQDQVTMAKATAMCSGNMQLLQSYAPLGGYININQCSLAGSCQQVFTTLKGFAGKFTACQLRAIKQCLANGISIIEDDHLVQKMEHDYRLPLRQGRDLEEVDGDGGDSYSYAANHTAKKSDGGEGPNNDPRLWNLSNPFIAVSNSVNDAGLQAGYLLPSSSGSAGRQYASGFKTQQLFSAQWNLDRLDQRTPPLDKQYEFGALGSAGTGSNVTIYVIDSGIRRTHQEFASWTDSFSRASFGYNFADGTADASDCDGHGTHISSTAAGRLTGVAKEAKVVGIRALNCQGVGSVSNVVAGLDWVAQNAVKPAVTMLSLGVQKGQWSDSLNAAVVMLTDTFGIPVVVAAGNSKIDSCTIAPAHVEQAISVAGMDLPSKFFNSTLWDMDVTYSWANTGRCVTIFAPGVDIMAACGGAARCPILNDSAYTWASGTSMATPHVAGLVAIYLEQHPTAKPSEVKLALQSSGTQNQMNFSVNAVLPGTPNLMVNSLALMNQAVVVASQGP